MQRSRAIWQPLTIGIILGVVRCIGGLIWFSPILIGWGVWALRDSGVVLEARHKRWGLAFLFIQLVLMVSILGRIVEELMKGSFGIAVAGANPHISATILFATLIPWEGLLRRNLIEHSDGRFGMVSCTLVLPAGIAFFFLQGLVETNTIGLAWFAGYIGSIVLCMALIVTTVSGMAHTIRADFINGRERSEYNRNG